MKYKKYNCNSFNIYTIQTDKFKTTHLELICRKKAVKEEMTTASFLADMLVENSKEYPKRRDLITRLEELYRPTIYSTTVRTGNILNVNFLLDFINPEYINEENYLEEVVKLFFSLILNPNVKNDEFDQKTFNLIKERIKRDINSLKENPSKEAIREAFNLMAETPTVYPLLGTLKDLKEITPSSLYKSYRKFFKEYTTDIFVIGNLDMDNFVELIKKYFINRYLNEINIPMMVDNPLVKKINIGEKESNNIQASLVMLFNIHGITEKEKNVVFQVFNYLFGNGGLTSKLYKSLREENSLCYGVNSMYLKQDNLLLVQVSLEKSSVKKAISLIKKDLKAMQNGHFDDSDLNDAIKNMQIALDLSSDNNISLLNNYVFNIYDSLPSLEERQKMYETITKEDIMNVAKKIKLNTVFTLKGRGNK